MLLRCESGEVDMELGKWWEAFQHASSGEREIMLLKDETQKKRRRNRSGRKPVSGAVSDDMADNGSSSADMVK